LATNLESALQAAYERFHQNTLQQSLDYEQSHNTLKKTLQENANLQQEIILLREELAKLKPTKKEVKS